VRTICDGSSNMVQAVAAALSVMKTSRNMLVGLPSQGGLPPGSTCIERCPRSMWNIGRQTVIGSLPSQLSGFMGWRILLYLEINLKPLAQYFRTYVLSASKAVGTGYRKKDLRRPPQYCWISCKYYFEFEELPVVKPFRFRTVSSLRTSRSWPELRCPVPAQS